MTPGLLEISGIVAPVFLIIGLGYFVRKIGVLSAEADASILRLTINLFVPLLALDVIVGNEALLRPENLFFPPLAGFLSVAFGYGISWLAAGWFGFRENLARRTFAFATGIQNYGYFPLPIILALFGKETAGVLLGFCVGVEICLWTLGIGLLTGNRAGGFFRRVLNAPILAIVFAVFLNLLGGGVWVPDWVQTAWGMLGACAIPCALLLTGALFSDFAIPKHLFAQPGLMGISLLVRSGVMPILLLGSAWFLPLDRDLTIVLAVQAAMPVAVAPLSIAKHYGGDSAVAMKVVLAGTLAGLITIPLLLKAGFRLLGIET